jgi:hypothetical protein
MEPEAIAKPLRCRLGRSKRVFMASLILILIVGLTGMSWGTAIKSSR